MPEMTGEDPRGEEGAILERGVLPIVERPRSGLSGSALIAIAVLVALLLFAVLDARRRASSAPAVSAQRADLPVSSEPPPLYVPEPAPEPPPVFVAPPAPAVPVLPTAVPVPEKPASPPPVVSAPPPPTPPAGVPPRTASGPALIVDSAPEAIPRNDASTSTSQAPTTGTPALPTNTDRAQASSFANRSTAVPQGTVIPAVLETAFDSTGSGFARALVQRDVRGFDGTQVLIPRGSRLIGEYAADTASGQKRAIIAWARLIRPDGATIAIGSPATDPVGRGGVRASVNSHFLERFAGAILQSTLDVGVNLASRAGHSSVILALPGSLQGATSDAVRPREVRPTLSVPRGTSIAVFVARDLDFTSVRSAP